MKEEQFLTPMHLDAGTNLYQVANKKRGIVGAHPCVRPQSWADTWVRPYKKIVFCLRLGIRRKRPGGKNRPPGYIGHKKTGPWGAGFKFNFLYQVAVKELQLSVVGAHPCVRPPKGGHAGPPLQKNLFDGNLVL